MPLFIEPSDWALWLGEEGIGAAELMKTPSYIKLDVVKVAHEINPTSAPIGPSHLWK